MPGQEQWTEADDTHLRRLVLILIWPGMSEKRTPIIKILPSVSCKEDHGGLDTMEFFSGKSDGFCD